MKTLSQTMAVLIAILLSACNNDSEPATTLPTDTLYDFATFESTSSGGSVFTLRKSNDSQLIQYTCTYSLDGNDKVSPGMRMIIGYLCDGHEPYTTGPINLLGARLLDNTQQLMLTGAASDYANWQSADTKIDIFTRTGQYLNLQMQIAGTNKVDIKELVLVADETTVEDEYPHLYLICKTGNNGDNMFTTYASFDISPVWDLETCLGVKVTCQTPNGLETTTFAKSAFSITPVQ